MEQRPLHWSERAKMYPLTSAPGASGGAKGGGSKQPRKGGGSRPSKSKPSRRFFLLTLIVILVVAIGAAVVLLWYMPNRGTSAEESELAARSLVRQAMTTLEKAYVEALSFDPQTIPPSTLRSIAPALTFNPVGDSSAATAPTARAQDEAVDYWGTPTSYAVGTISNGGTAYGVVVDKENDSKTYYVNGNQVADWEQQGGAGDASASETTLAPETTTTEATSLPQTGVIGAATDTEAIMLLRDSMVSIESAFAGVGTFETSALTADLLSRMDPSVTFLIRDGDDAATAPMGPASDNTVDFFGTATSYAVGTVSASGTSFGVIVKKGAGGQTTTYYVNGQVEDWSEQLPTPVIGGVLPHKG